MAIMSSKVDAFDFKSCYVMHVALLYHTMYIIIQLKVATFEYSTIVWWIMTAILIFFLKYINLLVKMYLKHFKK